jgi:uncharacterized Zn finger protein
MGRHDYGWGPYVSVAERRQKAALKIAKMKKAGRKISPIEISGRKIASTFWGDAWCTNLEAYSDYSNRLPRGRTYVRNGSVLDLQIEAGRLHSLVSGSDIYEIEINIEPLAKSLWTDIKCQCAGQIGSLVELLRGSISKGVMEIVTRQGQGLFPTPKEISMNCSCPDWATMCKHVAATLYGVGARLDHDPEMLFILRGVDLAEMIKAAAEQPPVAGAARRGRLLSSDDLSSVFGVDIDLDGASVEEASPKTKPDPKARHSAKKTAKISKQKSKTKTPAKPAKLDKDLAKAPGEKAAPKTKPGPKARPDAKKTAKISKQKRKTKTPAKPPKLDKDLAKASGVKASPKPKPGPTATPDNKKTGQNSPATLKPTIPDQVSPKEPASTRKTSRKRASARKKTTP